MTPEQAITEYLKQNGWHRSVFNNHYVKSGRSAYFCIYSDNILIRPDNPGLYPDRIINYSDPKLFD